MSRKIEIRSTDFTSPPAKAKASIDCVLAIDCSGSMMATDYPPSRFEAARKAARLFTTRKILQGYQDRVGLVGFGGSATVLQALTPDLSLVERAVDSVAMSHTGTGIGEALRVSRDVLCSVPGQARRAIILLSDGENTAGQDPRELLGDMRGVAVYTIGLGSVKGQQIDLPGLGPVTVRLDEGMLRDIAQRAGGRYYFAPKAGDLLDIFATLADV